MSGMTRRTALATMAAACGTMLGGGAPLALATSSRISYGTPQPFSFARLKRMAARLADTPWIPPAVTFDRILQDIDYQAFHQITYRRDRSLWGDGDAAPPVQLFHLGRYQREPVTVSVVEDGEAREILYRQTYFDMPAQHVARQLPQGIGFAGFRAMAEDQSWDWLSFLGASYFRSPGGGKQYGLSARGLAIDTALPSGEEFPRFSHLWLEPVAGDRRRLIVHALLDGPSVTGAYRFDCRRADGVTMDVDMQIFPRRSIERLGIAPLTSMFWYGEKDRRYAPDWRPEIHDSDGLALWTASDERIWRPLNNPAGVMTNSFADENPRGFGLLQRDRNFDHYQDDGVFYDRRPSLWVEPLGSWGRGAVQLVEIPTEDEVHDNIVAYWVPEAKAIPGRPLDFRYRLHWDDEEPYPAASGRVRETFIGIGGIPGQERPRDLHQFVVDFTGGELGSFGPRDGVEPVIAASRGSIVRSGAYPVVGREGIFRATFEIRAAGPDAVDLRLFLKKGEDALTETWLYQYFPEDPRLQAASR